jgi:hypothetical protein
LTITYILWIGFDLLFPSEAVPENWRRYPWHVALVFCSFFNFFAAKFN